MTEYYVLIKTKSKMFSVLFLYLVEHTGEAIPTTCLLQYSSFALLFAIYIYSIHSCYIEAWKCKTGEYCFFVHKSFGGYFYENRGYESSTWPEARMLFISQYRLLPSQYIHTGGGWYNSSLVRYLFMQPFIDCHLQLSMKKRNTNGANIRYINLLVTGRQAQTSEP